MRRSGTPGRRIFVPLEKIVCGHTEIVGDLFDTPLSKDRGFSLDDTNVSSIDELTPCVPRLSVLSLTDIS